jgi:hypothetical protein
MRPTRCEIVAAAVLLAGLASSRLEAQSIRGELSDASTGQALSGVLLVLVSAELDEVSSVQTDERGNFALAAPMVGDYRIRAEKAGYRPVVSRAVRLERGDTLAVSIRLSSETIVLESVVVAPIPADVPVRARGFYERKNAAVYGVFITREDIARTRPNRTSDLLRRIPGAQLTGGRGDGFTTRLRAGCTPAVFLDGSKLQAGGAGIDDLVRPSDVEGIEVYRSMSEAPPEYQGLNSGCSVVLIWTRIRV